MCGQVREPEGNDLPLVQIVPASEEGRSDDEGPQHRVTIDYPFAVGVYEVTFDEWEACVPGRRMRGCRR